MPSNWSFRPFWLSLPTCNYWLIPGKENVSFLNQSSASSLLTWVTQGLVCISSGKPDLKGKFCCASLHLGPVEKTKGQEVGLGSWILVCFLWGIRSETAAGTVPGPCAFQLRRPWDSDLCYCCPQKTLRNTPGQCQLGVPPPAVGDHLVTP